MSKLLSKLAITVAIAGVLAWPVNTASAQSAEEIEGMVKAILEKMRQLEQDLAKASLEPGSMQALIEQLKEVVQSGNVDKLPQSLRDFLAANPDLLAKLRNPNASAAELRSAEDDIRRLLAQNERGLEELLKKNPEMLKRLMEQPEQMQEALKKHSEIENDLQNLFKQTKSEMVQTEEDIKKLIELAQSMQQQMNSQGQDPKKLDQEGQQQNQETRPENENNKVNDPKQAQNEYNAPPARNPTGERRPVVDPNSWDTMLPPTELEKARNATRSPQPRKYQLEAERYYLKLARAAQRERESRGDSSTAPTNPNSNGATNPSGSGN